MVAATNNNLDIFGEVEIYEVDPRDDCSPKDGGTARAVFSGAGSRQEPPW